MLPSGFRAFRQWVRETLHGYLCNEYLSAFLARRRVESMTGRGEFFEFTTSGISVHPRMTASQPESFNF